jgi:replicative DNA helicase
MSTDKFKRKRTRQMLRATLAEFDYAIRAKRAEKTVIRQMQDKLDECSKLIGGRLQPNQKVEEVDEIFPRCRERWHSQQAEPISTGIDSFDMDIQGGVSPDTDGRLNVIAARTGVGKTTVGCAVAMGLCMNGAHVLYLSPELSSERVWPRLMSRYAYQNPAVEWRGLSMHALGQRGGGGPAHGEALMADWQLQRQKGEVGRMHVYGSHHIAPSEIIDVIFAAKAKDPDICCVVLDHFHAMKSEKGMDIWATYRQTPEQLISAARASRVDIFCLAQLNRDAETTKKPELHQIRGTDNLGMNADAAWIIARPKSENGDDQLNQNELICYHEKFRDAQIQKDGRKTNKMTTQLSLDRDFCAVVG